MISSLSKTLQNLRKDKSLIVYDTHMHPNDVMGVVDDSQDLSKVKPIDYKKASSVEILKLGFVANIILEIFFKLTPSIVKSSIKSMYAKNGVARMLEEMDYAGIDKGVLVPVEPWVSTKRIYDNFKDERFIFLGSVDIHNTSLENLESNLNSLVNLKIKGLKLHPNLQGFYPQPYDNDEKVGKKLHLIYNFVQKKGLYILFHGGYTRFTNVDSVSLDIKKVSRLRGHDYALLGRFCDINGKSEIFENYNFPVIIAHLGSYALIKPDLKIFKVIADKFPNVYFDTAGVSPRLILKGIEIAGSKRIIFGSDVQYYSLYSSVQFCLDAIEKSKTNESKEDMIINIFGNNFKQIIRA